MKCSLIGPFAAVCCILLTSPFTVFGQLRSADSILPRDVAYSDKVPSPQQYFGFEIGSRHLRHDQLVSYLWKLAETSERVQVVEYGRSHDGRPLLLLTISAPENLEQVAEIRALHRRLAIPRKSDQVDIDELPVVVNIAYGVHGDEPSASNASALVAYWLASGQSEEIDMLIRNAVILLDPCVNPDGFDRFAAWANTFRGRNWNSDSNHAEHRQGWPSGRSNYYWFDLNRDYLPVQQPETQARMRWYHQWKPNVVLDYHEMGTRSTYFFQPGVISRTNPLIPEKNVELTASIGQYNAAALDQIGTLYFTKESFDDFYPGKGSTYPDLHGGVGILFEQSSSRGQVQRNQHGLLKFADTIRNQFTTSIASLRAAVAHRSELLDYKRTFYQQSARLARENEFQTYLYTAPGNPSRLQALAELLLHHDIQCFWLREHTVLDDQLFDARYTLAVPVRQPEYLFLQSLVERRTKFSDDSFYDISAWSVPLAFGVIETAVVQAVPAESRAPARIGGGPRTAHRDPIDTDIFQDSNNEVVAYAVDWRDDRVVNWLQQWLNEDVYVEVARRPFVTKTIAANGDIENQSFPRGTLMIPLGVEANRRPATRRLVQRAIRQGIAIKPIVSGLSIEGPDLGSQYFSPVAPPKVAMLVGTGVSSSQAGQVWHHLDTRIDMPLTLLDATRFEIRSLAEYNVLVVCGGSYSFSQSQFDSLSQWVRNGNTMIVLTSSVSTVGRGILGYDVVTTGGDATSTADPNISPEEAAAERQFPLFDSQVPTTPNHRISGAIFETRVDTTHPMLYGYTDDTLSTFRTGVMRLAHAASAVQNPVIYQKLLAGYASEKSQESLRETPAVTVHELGGGRVILFADDPLFRAYWFGTERLFNNSLYFRNQFSSLRAFEEDSGAGVEEED